MLIKNDLSAISSYFEDSSNLKGGTAQNVAFPETVDDISFILKDATARHTPVTISGGGTGTTGARIPFGGVSVSMERLNRIIDVSAEKMSATVQAGVLVEDLKKKCEDMGLFYTSHPTEKTAFVGGTVATNASGARSFKYGPTRRYVKKLKIALSSGKIIDIERGKSFIKYSDKIIKFPDGTELKFTMPRYKMPEVKNAAGYFAKDGMDLIDLFIGQEGTLAIIVELEMGLVRKPAEIFTCFAFFKKAEDSWGFVEDLRQASRDLSTAGDFDMLSIEYFDSNALNYLRSRNLNVPKGACAAIYFEQNPNERDDSLIIEKWQELMLKHNSSIEDTWVAMTEKEAEVFASFRYAIPETVNEIFRHYGFQKLSTDIAVPEPKFKEMMAFYVDSFNQEKLDHVIFGHIGESHVHVNILPKSKDELSRAQVLAMKFIKKGVLMGGTISAEHGIGKIKHRYLEEMYGREGLLEMARVKKALDPACILGLNNIFPKELLDLV